MKLSDYELVSECRYQSARAAGSETAADELTESRTEAIKYYLGRPRGDEKDGCSHIISMDISDTIHAMLAQTLPVFANDTVCTFEAVDEQDEEQVQDESDLCNYMIMEKNKGYILFETLLKDALLSKNAVCKVFVEEESEVERERYTDLSEVEMYEALQPTAENQEVIATKVDQEKGILNLKRVTTHRELEIQAVAPENFATSTDLRSPFIKDASYCRERFWRTRSELIKEGYPAKLVMELPRATTDTKVDSVERNQIQDEQNFHNNNESMQVCEIEEHYIRIDYDGDGVAELMKVVTCENHLLSKEEVPCIPYATGVAFLMGHRFYGLSIYDLLKNVQDGKTMFLRQWMDNALIGNHKKYKVIEEDTNMDDLLNGRAVGAIRVKHPDAVTEMPVNDIGPSCAMGLEYLDKVRTERTGSALDLQTQQMNTPHNVGDQGVNTLVANLEQISSMVIKNFSETLVSQLYLLVHKFLKLYFNQNVSAKSGGRWVKANPGQWKDRDQINISVGLTKSERLVQQVAIEKIINKQQELMMMGYEGIIADKKGYHRALLDHARLSGIDHPEKYWIDPNSEEAQQAGQSKAQQAQQQQQEQFGLQMQLVQAQIAEVQRNAINDQEELKYKYAELEQKYQDMMLKYETEEAKIVGKATTDMEIAQLNAQRVANANP